MEPIVIGKLVAEEQKRHDTKIRELETLRPFAELANEIAWQVVPDDWSARLHIYGRKACIDVHLKEHQSVRDVALPLLRAFARTRKLKPAEFHKVDNQGMFWWFFAPRDADAGDDYGIEVTIHASNSKVCRRVPTGRMIPEYTTICT